MCHELTPIFEEALSHTVATWMFAQRVELIGERLHPGVQKEPLKSTWVLGHSLISTRATQAVPDLPSSVSDAQTCSQPSIATAEPSKTPKPSLQALSSGGHPPQKRTSKGFSVPCPLAAHVLIVPWSPSKIGSANGGNWWPG